MKVIIQQAGSEIPAISEAEVFALWVGGETWGTPTPARGYPPLGLCPCTPVYFLPLILKISQLIRLDSEGLLVDNS